MIANVYLEEVARELLEKEMAESSPAQGAALEASDQPWQEPGGVFWLLPDLVRLVEEHRDQPVAKLAPMIRRLVLEHTFVNEKCGSPTEAVVRSEADARVRQLVRVMERVRELGQAHGLWSDAPVTPIMFG